MLGKTLFNKYASKRDFSGSAQDEYAQLLETLQLALPNDIYSLLEKADKQNKSLSVKETESEGFSPEITIDAIVLV